MKYRDWNDSFHNNSNYKELSKEESDNEMFLRYQEDGAMLFLIDQFKVAPNTYNSMEWTQNLYERIQNQSTVSYLEKLLYKHNISDDVYFKLHKELSPFPSEVGDLSFDGLEKQFNAIGNRDYIELPYKSDYRFEAPLDIFLSDIYCGFYPAPELLIMIAKCFHLYFLSEGELELEDVFFGKPIKKSGNYSRRKARSDNYKHFHQLVTWAKEDPDDKHHHYSLEEHALYCLKSAEDTDLDCPINTSEADIDLYLSGYFRWKSKLRNNSTNN